MEIPTSVEMTSMIADSIGSVVFDIKTTDIASSDRSMKNSTPMLATPKQPRKLQTAHEVIILTQEASEPPKFDTTSIHAIQTPLSIETLSTTTADSLKLHADAALTPMSSILKSPSKKNTVTSASSSTRRTFPLRNDRIDRASPLMSTFDVPKHHRKPIYAIAEYFPQMSDEIQINIGDRIVIMRAFKDEWVLGKNETTSATGVFPKACCDLDIVPNGTLLSISHASMEAGTWVPGRE
eukprot:jgi/Hompol1/2375/HPOL_005976-RA